MAFGIANCKIDSRDLPGPRAAWVLTILRPPGRCRRVIGDQEGRTCHGRWLVEGTFHWIVTSEL
jgi:hypothetical protein